MSIPLLIAAWVVVIAVITFGFQWILERQQHPNRDLAAELHQTGTQEVRLIRNRQGHYLAPGLINGQPVRFLVDTGATRVAIPAVLAGQLGVPRGPASASQTAGGIVTTYLTRLDSVQLGGLHQTNVAGTIVPSMSGDYVLLGMSFLKHFSLQQSGDELLISKTK